MKKTQVQKSIPQDLFHPIETYYKLSKTIKSYFDQNQIKTFADLLLHLPSRVSIREEILGMSDIKEKNLAHECIIRVKVCKIENIRKRPFRVILQTQGGMTFEALFFNAAPSYVRHTFTLGKELYILGTLQKRNTTLQMVHPKPVAESQLNYYRHQIHYPGASTIVSKKIKDIFEDISPLFVTHTEQSKNNSNFSFNYSYLIQQIYLLHKSLNTLKVSDEVIFGEFLGSRIAWLRSVKRYNSATGVNLHLNYDLVGSALKLLPFSLTDSQVDNLEKLKISMASFPRDTFLLQGDVGSGKTILAFLLSLFFLRDDYQVAFTAPTEILAAQHHRNFIKFFGKLNVKTSLLTGSTTFRERTKILDDLNQSETRILFGTHAILEDDVQFKNLKLCVIDEQHRFGVKQRLKLKDKGECVSTLSLSATPIPRSLSLMMVNPDRLFSLTEKPAHRVEIKTRVIPLQKTEQIEHSLDRALKAHQKIYWVCPRIDENEEEETAAVEKRFKSLHALYGRKVGLLHGRMTEADKSQKLMDFYNGHTPILVSTTVIEVGIDDPEATIMIIEEAEKFGLAQLHQLRGRVGRGTKPSSCILMYSPQSGSKSIKRLEILRSSNDGFYIAEEDLKLRGQGDLMGIQQSGQKQYHFADPLAHFHLMKQADIMARLILDKDPELTLPEHHDYRRLLKLFGLEDAQKYYHNS